MTVYQLAGWLIIAVMALGIFCWMLHDLGWRGTFELLCIGVVVSAGVGLLVVALFLIQGVIP